VDAVGMVYATDETNNRVQQFDDDGTFLVAWGIYGRDLGELIAPGGLDIDGAGSVYVADSSNDRIERFSPVPPDTTIDGAARALFSTPTFALSSDQDYGSFERQIDGGAWEACDASCSVGPLIDGSHTIEARAVSWTGQVDPSPASVGFVVDLAEHRPDAQLKIGRVVIGDDVYDASGRGQAGVVALERGEKVTVRLRFENDGTDTDRYAVTGNPSTGPYRLAYLTSAGEPVTNKVTAGLYEWDRSPGSVWSLLLRIRVTREAVIGERHRFKVVLTSLHDPAKVDTVRIRAKVTA
jgi:hypothetical protein